MDSKSPIVSVITPSYNQGLFIERTIKSILQQDYQNIEYIIIDGASTDDTRDKVNSYLKNIIFVSEPDKGQADAVNKGVNMSKGDIIGWINSDDTYNEGAVSSIVDYFQKHEDAVMVYGDAYHIDSNDNILGVYPSEEFNFNRLADTCFICQPSVFLKKSVFSKIGYLDTDLFTCMDYEYWMRLGQHYSNKYITYLKGNFLANSRMYSRNKTFHMRKTVYKEAMKLQKKYFGRKSSYWIRGYIKEIILGARHKLK